jgi:3-oxoacyl-[acyl-carrier protein] reductase
VSCRTFTSPIWLENRSGSGGFAEKAMNKLNGKIALVTGGARGLGEAITTRLSDEGASVAFTYQSSADAAADIQHRLAKEGRAVIAINADLFQPENVRAAVTVTAKVFGALDILVNNAGITVPGHIDEISMDALDRIININVKSVYVAIQEAVRYMRDGGRIINIGSISSDYMPVAGQAAYSMTKGAVASLTRALAREFGPRRITINNVQPGRVDTDLLRALDVPLGEIARSTAVQRLGAPEEVASIVAYLSSDEAAYVTGANIRVDGGTSA